MLPMPQTCQLTGLIHLVDSKEQSAAEARHQTRVDALQALQHCCLLCCLQFGVVQQVDGGINTVQQTLNLWYTNQGGG